jgi:hypothetical protein
VVEVKQGEGGCKISIERYFWFKGDFLDVLVWCVWVFKW